MIKPKNKGGRPNLYKTRIEPFIDVIADLRAKGRTDEFIADLLGISRKTFFTHKSKVDDFLHAYKNADDILLNNIENSLFDLALGKATKRTVTIRKDADGNVTSQEERIEHLPPDKIAAFFVLTNRKADEWKHRQETTVETNTEAISAIQELTDTINESK